VTAFRKPFVPPTDAAPLLVRSITYVGEENHPVTPKRVIVAPLSKLPLVSPAAIHKFKLLAGARWTIEPPKDGGFSDAEKSDKHGFIKISCEDFPKAAMNLKWASDALDRLITEANDVSSTTTRFTTCHSNYFQTADSFADIPLDTSHIDARARKSGKGDVYSGRAGLRPSLRDFPKEWLPDVPSVPTTSPNSPQ
jgi:small subunit ribosomal protein S35